MALTLPEFLAELEKGPTSSNRGDCPLCGDPISGQLREDDEHIVVDGVKQLVHQDCYFEDMGKEIDMHPIGRKHRHGGAVAGD